LLAASVAEVLGPGRAKAFWGLRSGSFIAYGIVALLGHAGIAAMLSCEGVTMAAVLALWGLALQRGHPRALPIVAALAASMVTAARGDDALKAIEREPIDLVVLDVMLPGTDGLEVCRRIRADHPTPIIMLSARGEELDKVLGLELGADDYVTKPFSPRELVS